MLDQVRATVARYNLLPTGQRVVVGVSGGPDSVVLLHALLQLREEFRLELHVAHLNHQLRGAEADADAAFVAELAASWGLPCTVERRDVQAVRGAQGLSPEEAARAVRYEFLTGVAARLPAGRVAVAHHAGDQAETVLLHLLRGGGSAALGGMAPLRGIIIRPLLEVSRQEIEAYRSIHSLPARFDSSNRNMDYLRNRVRLELLPFLQRDFNPRMVEALNRTAQLLREENELLDSLTGQAWKQVARTLMPGLAVLDGEELEIQERAVRRRLIRRAYAHASGRERPLGFAAVERVLNLAEGKVANLPGRLSARRRSGLLIISRPEGKARLPEFACLLPMPGEVHLPENGGVLRAELQDWPEGRDPVSLRFLPAAEAYLAWRGVTQPLTVRNRRVGDAFYPMGTGGRKKLQDFLVDAGVPRLVRDAIPLVCSGDDILWVVGYRVDQRWQVDQQTKQVLHLVLTPPESGPASLDLC